MALSPVIRSPISEVIRQVLGVGQPPSPGDPLLELFAFAPDPLSEEMQMLVTGDTPASYVHTSTNYVKDYTGKYVPVVEDEPLWQGARYELDPSKLVVELTATQELTLSSKVSTVNAGTWGVDYGTHIEYGYISTASPTSEVAAGETIRWYVWDDITTLWIGNNALSGAFPDLSQMPFLDNFRIYNNQVTGSISDLSSNTALKAFQGQDNQITGSIPDLSSNIALTDFLCQNNQLTGSIPDLSSNTALKDFRCYNNQITGSIPGLSSNTALQYFYCYNNQLTGSIPDLSSNTALLRFYCYSNQLTGSIPDLSSQTVLIHFYCYSNQITGSIPDLSNNATLSKFYCDNNQLTGSIPDLSSNTALTSFRCSDNQLTDFAGGWPSQAFRLEANNNALTEAAVNQILIDADTFGTPVGTVIWLYGGTSAAPTGAGLTAKNNLIANGATVNTN